MWFHNAFCKQNAFGNRKNFVPCKSVCDLVCSNSPLQTSHSKGWAHSCTCAWEERLFSAVFIWIWPFTLRASARLCVLGRTGNLYCCFFVKRELTLYGEEQRTVHSKGIMRIYALCFTMKTIHKLYHSRLSLPPPEPWSLNASRAAVSGDSLSLSLIIGLPLASGAFSSVVGQGVDTYAKEDFNTSDLRPSSIISLHQMKSFLNPRLHITVFAQNADITLQKKTLLVRTAEQGIITM